MDTQTPREFISESGKASVMGGIGAFSSATWENQLSHKFIHHVYFWLKHPDSAEDKRALLDGLRKLSAVKTIRMCHIGVPADTNREVIDRSYSVSWMVVFDNGEDQASYQVDPIHLRFVEECSALWQKVTVFDTVEAI